MEFTTVAINVAIMLAYSIPGYLLIKLKAVKEDAIPAFSKVLMYVCQPCLSIYTFQKVQYTKELAINMLIFFAIAICFQALMLVILRLIYSKKYNDDFKYKVAVVTPILGNVGFFGIPLLESLLPNNPEALAYGAVFIISFNLIAWTLGAYFLTGDKSFVSGKKAFLNPPVLTLFITLPLFFTKTTMPDVILNCVTILGKFTTPLCMIILGMRFATTNPKELFTNPYTYISSGIKLVIFPLLAFLATHFLPIDPVMKTTMFIVCCCPTASVVLSLAEISGKGGQKEAAHAMIMSTMFCLVTIPVLLLLA